MHIYQHPIHFRTCQMDDRQ